MGIMQRRLIIFGAPLLVGIVNLMHPILSPPVYPKVAQHLPMWIHVHMLNLLLFPALGLAALVLLSDVRNGAATLSTVALALFIPIYAGYDALVGLGTGTLVHASHGLPADQLAAAQTLADAYWGDRFPLLIGLIGSILWVIGMFSAAVAITARERQKIFAITSIPLFLLTGWARGNIFLAADGITIRGAWWIVTILTGLAVLAVGKPRVPAALLVLAGALFGAYHVPPTGPFGALCFLGAAIHLEIFSAKNRPAAKVANA